MTQRKISVGALVWHEKHGIGRIDKVGDSGGVVVDFQSLGPHSMGGSVASNLKVLSEDGLEARLWQSREETASWAKEAPLRLVAAALVDIGETAKAVLLQEKLENIVVENAGKKWANWWEDVRTAIDDPKYFSVKRNKNGAFQAVSLARGTRVDDVPEIPLPDKPRTSKTPKKKAATGKDWEQWLAGNTDGPAPGNRPNQAVFKCLSTWKDRTTIGSALSRTLEGASGWLDSGSTSAQVAAGWLQAVASISARVRELIRDELDFRAAQDIGKVAVPLARMAERNKDWFARLGQAVELDRVPDDWRLAVRSGMWQSLREMSDMGEGLLKALLPYLGRQGQAALAEDLALAAFRADGPPQSHFQVDRLLYAIPEGVRTQVVHNFVLRAASGDAPKTVVADYVTNSRHVSNAGRNTRLGLLMTATLMLTDGRGQVVDQASAELADALESPHESATPTRGLFRDTRARNEELRATTVAEAQAPLRAAEAELEGARREEARLRQQVRTFRTHMASEREESRLEVRQGMLLAIGEVLDRAYRPGKEDAERLQHVIDGLRIALAEGDAEILGTAGEVAPYDPRFHHSAVALPKGSMVRLWAPGVVVRGGQFGDKIVLKANVTASETAVEKSEVTA